MVNDSESSAPGGFYPGGLRFVVPPFWGRQPSEVTEDDTHDEADESAGGVGSSSTATEEPSHRPQHLYNHHHHGADAPSLRNDPRYIHHTGAPPEPRSSVRSVFDGLMSPLMSCVQPPIAACVPSGTWDYYEGSQYGGRQRTASSGGGGSSYSVVSPVLSTPSPSSSDDRHYGVAGAPGATSGLVKPRYNDVVCGRGGGNARHPGNQNFRELIAANKATYAGLTKKQKMMMARQIVELIHSTRPPGRFLARDPQTGLWEDIGLPRSLEKASQAFRDASCEPVSDVEHPTIPANSPAPVLTPKSSRAPPPPPPIHIPAHLQSVFQRPSPSFVNSDAFPPSPSPYLQTPVLIESASSVSSTKSRNPATSRYLAFRSSADSLHSGTQRSGSQLSTPTATPGSYGCPPPLLTPASSSARSSSAVPMFTDEPESPIELAYSCSSISVPSDLADQLDDWRGSGPPPPRWPDDGASSAASAAAASAVPSAASSSSFPASWLPPSGDRTGGGGGNRILFSPSGLLQSRRHPPRHRCSAPSLLHPYHSHPQQPLDDSDSMDGLTALSTAAFLRLDETD